MNVIRKLGSGGFGDVYEVQDAFGFRVARKVYRAADMPGIDEADLKNRFRREVKYQGAIQSPNVVKVIGHDLDAEPPYFDMELGICSLADEIDKDRTLGGIPSKALFDILAGLDVLHSRGFVHRDLKPHNVIKFVDHGIERYALSDFGLINVGTAATSSLTTSNMAGGSPRWAAPECMISLKKATHLADIYSFGTILHDIFEGTPRLPFSELSGSGPIGAVIERCTKSVPQRRYSTISDLREALFAAIGNQPFAIASNEEARVLGLLGSGGKLSDKEWDEVFLFIDRNDNKWQANVNVFQALLRDQLRELNVSSPELLRAIGVEFCNYAANGTFSFDYCDVIGGKAEIFYELGDIDLKALVAVAMLRMGSSHNRWYIQRLFINMSSPEIADGLAHRIAIEIEVQEIDFTRMFRQSESTISASSLQIHPMIAELLSK